MSDESNYAKHYSEDGFWKKLKKFAITAGIKVVYSGLILYYALESPKVSAKDKAIIYAALGYLILPVDAIPDLVPVVGFTDDLGVLLFAAVRIALCVDDDVKRKARAKLVEFFGPNAINQNEIDEVDKQIDGDDDPDPSPVK